ncbi:hypothetical protein CMU97_16040 [Elizabethkingia anophelis]|nr:hypothetical protein [Elizabethkingia anophelis]MDV3529513.1 hypothetical protein [Elizabethkingia anophelis]
MKLKGIIDHVFGNQLCFRGFAKIGDLAKISYSNSSYQRLDDKKRIEDLIEFYRNSQFRFFSELTLCLNINDQVSIQKIIEGSKHQIEEGIQYLPTGADFKKYAASDKFVDPALRSVTFEISDNLTKKVLARIDGNHRLSAIDYILSKIESNKENSNKGNEIKDDNFDFKVNDEILNYYVPFNIIIQSKSIESDKNEAAYFHLINSKSIPLNSEDNLKSLFNKELFSDDDLKSLISENAVFARDLYYRFKEYKFLGLKSLVESGEKSFFLQITDLPEITLDLNKIQNSIQLTDNLFYEKVELSQHYNSNIALSILFAKNEFDSTTYRKYLEWIFNNHLNEISEVYPTTLINIFKTIHSKRKYKVFVAMPYWSHPEVNEYNSLFKEACKDVSNKLRTTVELIPIMRFSGKSQRIDSRLIKCIKECDIFIADITGCNKNVIFEVGLAEGLNKPMILVKDENDPKLPPFDMDKLQYIPYNKKIYFTAIKGIVTRNLISLLKDDFKIS